MVACLGCARPGPACRCTGCGVARFCGRECQRDAWQGHRPFCVTSAPPPRALGAEEIARESAAFYGIPEREEAFREDAEVQAEVLQALGLRAGGRALGQRPASERWLWDAVTQARGGLALSLFGRNSFPGSYMPVLRTYTQDMRWPTLFSARDQGHLTELPTLELCCALVTRILCVARRLRAAGQRRLIFLGLGSGDALVEASVALHLGAALGAAVDLREGPPLRLWYGDIEISVIATDSPDAGVRQRNRTFEATGELPVVALDRREAVRQYAAEAPLYVFSCWMPMGASRWRADAEEDAGGRLAELCFLSAPPTLIKIPESELRSKLRPTIELFPKTLGRWDFLARGCEEAGGEEAGLFHSQLYIFPDARSPPPFLAAPARHQRGNYVARMLADKGLQGVNYCRGIGLYHIHSPDDFEAEVPEQHMFSLRESAMADQMAIDASTLQEQLRDCLRFLGGQGHRQVSGLLRDLQRKYPAASYR